MFSSLQRKWQLARQVTRLGACAASQPRTRRLIVVCLLVLSGSAAKVSAVPFGYSVNINFAADAQRVRGTAGKFGDTVWNVLPVKPQQELTPLLVDRFGKVFQSRAQIGWSDGVVGRSQNLRTDRVGDLDIMEGFLDSPKKLVLRNLDGVVPTLEDVTVSLILYTHAGQQDRIGTYRVNGRTQTRRDSAIFDGRFRDGVGGNLVVFKDIQANDLVIDTEGFGPINAMSLVYCRTGDINGDGSIDIEDLNELGDAVKHGGSARKFDMNLDLTVDHDDVMSWIKCAKGTCIGDVNLDGVFDSTDLVELFQDGLYETGNDAMWQNGDWNGDCKFDSSDLLLAFQDGCYESEMNFDPAVPIDASPEVILQHIPEPASGVLGLGAFATLFLFRRRSR